MKSILFAALLAASVFHFSNAQSTLPASRKVDWSSAGYGGKTPVYSRVLNILQFGAIDDGSASCNAALQAALSSLYSQPGVIFFPEGTYFFNQPVSLPSGVVLKGAGSAQTELIFDLKGANTDLISMAGNIQPVSALLAAAVAKGSTSISVNTTAGFFAGDYIRLSQNDAALVTSAWARGSVGQLVKISSISGNMLHLQSPLRKGYSLADAPVITRMQPVTGSGVECLAIRRVDASSWQTSNIRIENAARCWVKNVESDSCNFAHVNLTTATNIEVSGSYFHGSFGYGGGGQGYGVILQSTSGECLVENNTFEHLRHSMLLQSGANGNVLAYNYSTLPYWSDVSVLLPTDASGDMVLHGNWPYANLFEGNWGQNMVIDNSHGANGPFNTFFRNRATNYGLAMNTGAGDSSNFAGNEITHAIKGLYLLTGNGNLEWGNAVKGVFLPALTGSPAEASLYRTTRPEYFSTEYTYPAFGQSNLTTTSTTIPAAAEAVDCCCGGGIVNEFVLPIRLQQFTAAATGCNVSLQWLATDAAGDSYEIESSSNARDFTTVATLTAKGGSLPNAYRYVSTPIASTTWYRLKMTSPDGNISYSSVKSIISTCAATSSLMIRPNPVGNVLHLQYTVAQAGKVLLSVADATGKIVHTSFATAQNGSNLLQQDVQQLPPGVYYISLRKTTGQLIGSHQKMIKAK